jgi:hypothetical protein
MRGSRASQFFPQSQFGFGVRACRCEPDASAIAATRAVQKPLFDHASMSAMPVFSSGQTGLQAHGTWRALGNADLIHAAGGGIFGHPGGVTAWVTAWMVREPPQAFASLVALNLPILHDKVCSTFDSSSDTGSIGRAIDMLQLRAGAGPARVRELAGPDVPCVPIVSIDVLDGETLAAAGPLFWQQRGQGLFGASSSGLQYALAAHWRIGALAQRGPAACRADLAGGAGGVDRRRGQRQLLAGLSPAARTTAPCAVSTPASRALGSPVRGPRSRWRAAWPRSCAPLARVPLQHVVVADGDSAGEVASLLDIAALSVIAGLAPGAPLCRALSERPERPERDGLQIVLKGDQMGSASFFGAAPAGAPSS